MKHADDKARLEGRIKEVEVDSVKNARDKGWLAQRIKELEGRYTRIEFPKLKVKVCSLYV